MSGGISIWDAPPLLSLSSLNNVVVIAPWDFASYVNYITGFPKWLSPNFHGFFLDIKACIATQILSPGTTYAAYPVYRLPESKSGFERAPIIMRVNYDQGVVMSVHSVIFDSPQGMPPGAWDRGDGWMEIEMGHFFNEGHNATLECSMMETSNPKSGLFVKCIELRPNKIFISNTLWKGSNSVCDLIKYDLLYFLYFKIPFITIYIFSIYFVHWFEINVIYPVRIQFEVDWIMDFFNPIWSNWYWIGWLVFIIKKENNEI